jgi:hypothetical protein
MTIKRRGWTITLCFGPVMWRCRDGSPNHRTEWWFALKAHRDRGDFTMPLLPALLFRRWRRGVLSNDPNLERVSHSLMIAIGWLVWELTLMVGRCKHTDRIP